MGRISIFAPLFISLLFIHGIISVESSYRYQSSSRYFSNLSQPGFKVVLTNAAIQYIENSCMPSLQQMLQTVQISAMSGSYGAPIIGSINWQFNNIVISSISLSSYSAWSNPGSGLEVDVNNINMVVNANWGWQQQNWPHVSGSGTAVINLNARDDMTVAILADQNTEFPFIRVVGQNFAINSMDISINSNAAWLYNLFTKILHDDIQNTISGAISNAIVQHIQDGVNQALQTVPLKQDLGAGLTFDLGFLPQPEANTGSIAFPESGETYVRANPVACPTNVCIQRSLPSAPAANGAMLAVHISDFVANSALFSAQQISLLEFWVLPTDVPSTSPVQLTTDSIGVYVPALKTQYPGKQMKCHAYTSDNPNAVFNPSGAIVTSKGAIDCYVIDGDKSIFVFDIVGNATATATANLTGWNLVPKINQIKFEFKLGQSTIGTFDPKPLKNAFNFMAAFGIIPSVNARLSAGIKLPQVNGLNFVNPSIGWYQNYISVYSNFQW